MIDSLSPCLTTSLTNLLLVHNTLATLIYMPPLI